MEDEPASKDLVGQVRLALPLIDVGLDEVETVPADRFRAQELWGEAADARDSICLDLWEPYLERA